MKKEPRYYQLECEQAFYDTWNERTGKIPYASVMTGLGKSLIFARISHKQALAGIGIPELPERGAGRSLVVANISKKESIQGRRVLQLVPRKELVEQNYKETLNQVDDKSSVGIVCAALGLSQLQKPIVVAMFQSFYNKRTLAGSFDVLLIDECDGVSNNEMSQIRKIVTSLWRINPKMVVGGMTASPYRLGQGMLHNPCIKGKNLFTDLVYDTTVHPGISRLIDEGYLAHIQVINTHVKLDLSGVKMSGLDYSVIDVGVKFDAIAESAALDFQESLKENNVSTSIIFVSTKANAEHIISHWQDKNTIRVIHDGITKKEREQAIAWLKTGTGCRTIVNVDILTRGFDFPALEAIAIMRATTSPGLLVQMVGRLLRPHEGKIGIVADYGTNFERLGAIDNIIPPKQRLKAGEKPVKFCLLCNCENNVSAKYCTNCNAKFVSDNETGNYKMVSEAEIFHAKRMRDENETEIAYVSFAAQKSKSGLDMLVVKFFGHSKLVHQEYVCLDHDGKARVIAQATIKKFFKDEDDFYKLGRKASVKNMVLLLNEHPSYFKKVTMIRTKKNPTSGYRDLIDIEFEELEYESI